MFVQKEVIGGFNTSLTYWSSTERDADNAFGVDFSQGTWYGEPIPVLKNSAKAVRPMRQF
jgi:hypothetical protein